MLIAICLQVTQKHQKLYIYIIIYANNPKTPKQKDKQLGPKRLIA